MYVGSVGARFLKEDLLFGLEVSATVGQNQPFWKKPRQRQMLVLILLLDASVNF